MRTRIALVQLSAALLAFSAGAAVRAQEGAPGEGAPAAAQRVTVPLPIPDAGAGGVRLEEVVVTSTKRVKAQRDLPGSVGAIRGADLEAAHAQGMRDYLKLVPGVAYLDQGNEESVPIIRGIAADISFGYTQLPTGIYLDDMPFADLFGAVGGSFPDINPFDLERVEVLKGPQGTLFGSGALAGAVRYIVEKPHFGLWEAKVSQTLAQSGGAGGSFSSTTAAAVNLPIGDTVALRAAGVFRREPGLYDAYADECTPGVNAPPIVVAPVCTGNRLRDDPDADRLKQTSARVLAAWNPFDRFNVSAFYFGQKTHSGELSWSDNTERFDRGRAPFASPRDHEFGGGNLSLTYDFDWARLLSSSNRMTKHNYAVQHAEYELGLGGQNALEDLTVLGQEILGWTQEIRLSSRDAPRSPWEWLVGGSYLHYHDSSWRYFDIGPYAPEPRSPDDVTQAQILLSQVYATAAELATEKALFGEVTRRLGKHWELTAGARRYQTRLGADTVLCGVQVLALLQRDCYPQRFDLEDQGLNPKFSVRYVHNKHVQAYLLAARGFQFGGIQVDPPAAGFEQSAEQHGFHYAPYKSSKLWNYESGIRTEWLNRRLRFDLAFFYLDWKDLQLTVQLAYLDTNLHFNTIQNVGRAHSAGVEAALEAVPFRGAKWTSSAAWINAVTDAPFDEQNPKGPVRPGTRLPGTPRFQIANVLAYEHALPILTSWSGGLTLTHAHIGTSPDAIRATGLIGGYDTLDARLLLADRASRFVPELSVGVNNLFDRRGLSYHLQLTNAVDGSPLDFYHFIPPRTLMTSVALKL